MSDKTIQVHIYGTCPDCLKRVRITEDGTTYSHKFRGDDCGYTGPLETCEVSVQESLQRFESDIEDYQYDIDHGYTPNITKSLHNKNIEIASTLKDILKNWKVQPLEQREVEVKRNSSAPPKQRGTCCICQSEVPVRKAGNISEHKICSGGGYPPLEENDSGLVDRMSYEANKIARIRFRLDHDMFTYDKNTVLKSARRRILEIECLRKVQIKFGFEQLPIIVNRLKIESHHDYENVSSIKLTYHGYKKPLTHRAVVLPDTRDIDRFNIKIAEWPPIQGEPPKAASNPAPLLDSISLEDVVREEENKAKSVFEPDVEIDIAELLRYAPESSNKPKMQPKKGFLRRLFGF